MNPYLLQDAVKATLERPDFITFLVTLVPDDRTKAIGPNSVSMGKVAASGRTDAAAASALLSVRLCKRGNREEGSSAQDGRYSRRYGVAIDLSKHLSSTKRNEIIAALDLEIEQLEQVRKLLADAPAETPKQHGRLKGSVKRVRGSLAPDHFQASRSGCGTSTSADREPFVHFVHPR